MSESDSESEWSDVDSDDLDSSDEESNEAGDDLYWSAQAGDLTKCQTLLAIGADVNYEDEDNETPLHTASLNGRTPIVKLLIENGALGTPSKKKFNGY